MKAIETKQNILESGLKLVRRLGFEAVSIGDLAKDVGMSKSGLFAHFKSKEALQLMILDHAALNFTTKVFKPAMKIERGLPRLKALIKNWQGWSHGQQTEGGCPLLTASIEFEDRPGAVKERVAEHIDHLVKSMTKACDLCVEEGHFKENVDTTQIAYEIYSYTVGSYIYRNTMGQALANTLFTKSLNDLLDRHSS